MEMIIHSQYFVYALYALAGIFLFFVVRDFIRRKLRRMIWLLVASMLSGGTGHAIQQSIVHEASQYAVQHVEGFIGNNK